MPCCQTKFKLRPNERKLQFFFFFFKTFCDFCDISSNKHDVLCSCNCFRQLNYANTWLQEKVVLQEYGLIWIGLFELLYKLLEISIQEVEVVCVLVNILELSYSSWMSFIISMKSSAGWIAFGCKETRLSI